MSDVKIETFKNVNISSGDLQLRIGKQLTTLAFKGKDVHVFHTSELEVLKKLIEKGLEELNKPV
jgi:hypothetical protein